ncbi:hypothetical protein G6F37_011133 [Rhizopus arrhizus]|nr:hypothetical protein G6F38_008286 [Rhizopus arrhizus]KAG1150749.1 hypothetical protein G6F37_011133 [Rhizopus arrhizus]
MNDNRAFKLVDGFFTEYSYKVMYLSPYPPELNPIEQFWGVVKGKMKRDRLLAEENLSDQIADACNDVLISDLYGFCNHSKR